VSLAPPDLAAGEMDARLERDVDAPLAVAFSGGGDSLALLLAAHAWARTRGRRLLALTVDHGLQAESRAWSDWCADRAARLGLTHRILTWNGPKPRAGIAAAARSARHRLIAEAARAAGARVILFGHTADDVLEAETMRADGLAVASPRLWSPSPVWPEGRDLFIQRPLIGARRQALRAWLTGLGETCIDDPANDDLRQPRARIRALIAAVGGRVPMPAASIDLSPLYAGASFGPSGDVNLPLEPLAAALAPELRRFLDAAIASVAGAERIAHGPFFYRLRDQVGRGETFVSTVGGAVTSCDGKSLSIVRETNDRRSRPTPSLALRPDEVVIWDGRFAVRARDDRLTLRPLAGCAGRLDRSCRDHLTALAPKVRRALPALVDPSGAVICPALRPDPRVEIRNLVTARLAGACGMVQNEAQIGGGDVQLL
jgi:tRNA(Ile)-lysidine synthase